jgi:hypothetical protein
MNETPEGESGTKGRHIVGNIDVTHNLTKDRGLRITRAVYSDDDLVLINERVDDMQSVLDRQFIKADVRAKEIELDHWAAQLQIAADGMEALATKVELHNKDPKANKLSSVDRTKIEKYDSDVRAINKHIERLKGMIEAAGVKLKELDEVAAARSGK